MSEQQEHPQPEETDSADAQSNKRFLGKLRDKKNTLQEKHGAKKVARDNERMRAETLKTRQERANTLPGSLSVPVDARSQRTVLESEVTAGRADNNKKAQLALLSFRLGVSDAPQRLVKEVLSADPDHPLAHALSGILTIGHAIQTTDPTRAVLMGEAAAHFAAAPGEQLSVLCTETDYSRVQEQMKTLNGLIRIGKAPEDAHSQLAILGLALLYQQSHGLNKDSKVLKMPPSKPSDTGAQKNAPPPSVLPAAPGAGDRDPIPWVRYDPEPSSEPFASPRLPIVEASKGLVVTDFGSVDEDAATEGNEGDLQALYDKVIAVRKEQQRKYFDLGVEEEPVVPALTDKEREIISLIGKEFAAVRAEDLEESIRLFALRADRPYMENLTIIHDKDGTKFSYHSRVGRRREFTTAFALLEDLQPQFKSRDSLEEKFATVYYDIDPNRFYFVPTPPENFELTEDTIDQYIFEPQQPIVILEGQNFIPNPIVAPYQYENPPSTDEWNTDCRFTMALEASNNDYLFSLAAAAAESKQQQETLYRTLAKTVLQIHKEREELLDKWLDAHGDPEDSNSVLAEIIKSEESDSESASFLSYTNGRYDRDATLTGMKESIDPLFQKLSTNSEILTQAEMAQIEKLSLSVNVPKIIETMKGQGLSGPPSGDGGPGGEPSDPDKGPTDDNEEQSGKTDDKTGQDDTYLGATNELNTTREPADGGHATVERRHYGSPGSLYDKMMTSVNGVLGSTGGGELDSSIQQAIGPRATWEDIMRAREGGAKSTRDSLRNEFINLVKLRGSTLSDEAIGTIFDTNKWVDLSTEQNHLIR